MGVALATMDAAEIARRKAETVRLWGEWTAHNIHLAEDIYTIGPDREADKLRRIVQIVSDLAQKPVEHLRILDLGCLEGGYAIELARHGAEVMAIEGRRANLEKVRFVKEVLGLSNLDLLQDDVRNLDPAIHGHFDVVLCLGLLYHLDAPDVFSFVHQIAAGCHGFAIFDTYVGVQNIQRFEYRGREYWGRLIREHLPQSSMEERLKSRWASLDNPNSVWIAHNSLYNLLSDAGFTSAYECNLPTELSKPGDRFTIVAMKGKTQSLLAMPRANRNAMGRLPKDTHRPYSRKQQFWPVAQERLTNLVPLTWRRSIKRSLPGFSARTRSSV
ncbi:methyltransferase domain-containing protein [Roseomonas xinghualingensis]|uniref:methyltransferase domain-containing protein n=1 Tax=Roseomonas xinghualingensis TaxID=2986475 RepID=UPI0021F1F25E|nr:class I SAM-dependent methyltransferase [Roseomonas sp. SXEYE001]MCV4210058.1 class I SAM-dependent methyltransferase [Roseomonas sp. SXEYE001]